MADNQGSNILIFSTAYLPLIGGAEIAVKEITDRVGDFEFDLVTARIKPELVKFEKIGRINVYRVGFGLGFWDKFLLPFLGFIKAINLNKEKNYVIIWSIMASQAGIAACFFKKLKPGKKMLLTLQEGDPEKHLRRYAGGTSFLYKLLIKPWHMLPFKCADHLTVISQYLKQRALRNKVGVPIKIIPNGVDLDIFKPGQKKQNQNEKVILTVSRLVKKNGVEDLIKASQYFDFDFKMVIIGDGPDKDSFKKLVNKLKLDDKIVFKGQINHRDLVEYYDSADVFVRPSLSEGLGNVFLEAMACGVPIIGTSVGGIPDFLEDRKTGLFCEASNPKNIAEKVKEILENDSLRENLIINGLELVKEKYDWDEIGLKMESVFKKL